MPYSQTLFTIKNQTWQPAQAQTQQAQKMKRVSSFLGKEKKNGGKSVPLQSENNKNKI